MGEMKSIEMKSIFIKGKTGSSTRYLPNSDVPGTDLTSFFGKDCLRETPPDLPAVSEPETIRHFSALARRNHGVDNGFYPLGSCTMKYNPKINEDIARMEGFECMHPYQDPLQAQGCLEVIYMMDKMLSEITGMGGFTLQPAAGAHGELTGLMIMKTYFEKQGDTKRTKIIVPDSAHGTNPASAAMVGFQVVEVKSDERGNVDCQKLSEMLDDTVAGLMLTNPNTLGLFEEHIVDISRLVHEAGALLYYDGANANAIVGVCRPGDMGFDIVHLNLHKTFSTPHGGGGPGSGPVGVCPELVRFLPKPIVIKAGDKYLPDYDRPDSIGRVRSFYGNFLVALKAYAYILSLGAEGLKEVSETAVLNANYLMSRLKDKFNLPYDRICKHEFVLSGVPQKEKGVSTLDMAKRLIDFGFHPPTVYFPLIVREAMMIEPTETESLETLNEFIRAMEQIALEAEENPDMLRTAPHSTPISRPDEALAARKPVLKWDPLVG